MEPLTIILALASIFFSIVNRDKSKRDQKELMDYSADINQDYYDENLSPPALMEKWTGMGMNPNLVAASLLGSGAGQSASAISGNPSVDTSAMSGLQNMFSQMTGQSLQRFLDDAEVQSRIDMNNSSALLNGVNAGLRPLEFQEQIRVDNATISSYLARAGLDKANAALIRQQTYWFGLHESAEISQIVANTGKAVAETNLLIEEAKTQGTLRELYKAQTGREYAATANINMDTNIKEQEWRAATSEAFMASDRQIIQGIIRSQVEKYGAALPEDVKERYVVLASSPDEDDQKQAAELLKGLEDASLAVEKGRAAAQWFGPIQQSWSGLGFSTSSPYSPREYGLHGFKMPGYNRP